MVATQLCSTRGRRQEQDQQDLLNHPDAKTTQKMPLNDYIKECTESKSDAIQFSKKES